MKAIVRPILILSFLLMGCTNDISEKEIELRNSIQPNILFISVDDLKGGVQGKYTPGLNELAERGVTFTNAFSNVPVCGASRASVMTGLRPTNKQFLYSYSRADEDAPQVPTIAKHFKDNGYFTASIGKITHHTDDSINSWSVEAWHPKNDPEIMSHTSRYNYLSPKNIAIARDKNTKRPVPYENIDVPDEAYFDGKIRLKATQVLKELSANAKPFFLAVGFVKPHLPFNAPKKYWDLYPPETISLADNPLFPANAPKEALHNYGELRNYSGIPDSPLPVPNSVAKTLIRGYYASTSYVDAQIALLLKSLKNQGLAKNTIIVLWGDHGFSLGNHSVWTKHSAFEIANKTSLIISAPGLAKNKVANGLVELVDLYPTISELAGLELPPHLQGDSLISLLENPDLPGKSAVYTRWKNSDTVRTLKYSYTEWRDDNSQVTANMLYNLKEDPLETNNLSDNKEYQVDVAKLNSLLVKHIGTY
jgi:iduronate 2-sulfatase